jgi:hypothetical protein
MKIKDKVKSRLSRWSGDIGEIYGIVPIWSLEEPDKKIGEYVHVVFPETDKHYAYQQSFNSKDLILVESVINACL